MIRCVNCSSYNGSLDFRKNPSCYHCRKVSRYASALNYDIQHYKLLYFILLIKFKFNRERLNFYLKCLEYIVWHGEVAWLMP